MKHIFNYTAGSIFVLLLTFATVKGQEYINPAKNLSVKVSSDTLLFKELISNKLIFKVLVKAGSASHYVKFSPSGDFLITSGNGPITTLYNVKNDTITLAASFPVLTEEGIFSSLEKELYLLHSRSFFKTSLSSYNTKSWGKLLDANFRFRAHDLTINASDSLIAFCEGTNIHTLHTSDLVTDEVFWQRSAQRLLTFNPKVSHQGASISKNNHIQIRDMKKDTVLTDINVHTSKIVWLGYDPTGTLLVSLDKQGNMFTWMPSSKQCIAHLKGVGGIPVFNQNGTLNLSSNGMGEEPVFVKTRPYHLDTAAMPPREISKMPVIDYSPETGLRIGLGLTVVYHPKVKKDISLRTRPTMVMPLISYGIKNNQVAAALETHIYAIKGWQLHSDFRYSIREKNYFFGIGDQSSRVNKQAYSSNTLRLNGNMLKMFNSAFSAGIAFSVQHDTPLKFEQEPAPTPEGVQGGWTIGVGPAIEIDNRNNTLFPTAGSLFNAAFYRYGLGNIGNYKYNEIKLDYRKYVPSNLLVKGSVFAFQALFNGTWGGNVPFYKLPYITADRALRGMWRNLYIDRQTTSVQGEFRSFFSARSTRYGYAVFAGAADGATNFLKNYSPDIKIVYGAGLRTQLFPKQRLDLRLDVAFNSKEDVGIYGGIGVSF